MKSRTTALIIVLVLLAAGAAAFFLTRPAGPPTTPTPAPGNEAASSTPGTGLANPASVACVNQGGTLEIKDEANGQVGYCHLPDGRVCEEWALFRDKTCTPPATGGTTATSTPSTQSDTAALNQRIYDFQVYITPLEVVSDSRCPMGVYCIQAGEVVIKAKLEDARHSEIVTMHQGSPIAFGNKHVTLMSVVPPRPQNGTIKPSDYRFTFSVAYGMGGEAP